MVNKPKDQEEGAEQNDERTDITITTKEMFLKTVFGTTTTYKRLLEEYPEMEKLKDKNYKNNQNEINVISKISCIYTNGNTIDSYINDVLKGESTGSIEYHLSLVEKALEELKILENADYNNFISKESEKLKNRKSKASEAIGDKKRINGLYQIAA